MVRCDRRALEGATLNLVLEALFLAAGGLGFRVAIFPFRVTPPHY